MFLRQKKGNNEKCIPLTNNTPPWPDFARVCPPWNAQKICCAKWPKTNFFGISKFLACFFWGVCRRFSKNFATKLIFSASEIYPLKTSKLCKFLLLLEHPTFSALCSSTAGRWKYEISCSCQNARDWIAHSKKNTFGNICNYPPNRK